MSLMNLECPHCHVVSNVQTDAGGQDAKPKPGNLMICCECGSQNILNEDMTTVHLMTDEERLDPGYQENKPEIEAYCTAVRDEYNAKAN